MWSRSLWRGSAVIHGNNKSTQGQYPREEANYPHPGPAEKSGPAKLYRTFFLEAPIAYLVLDPNATIAESNRQARVLLHNEGADLTGRSFLEFLPKEHRERFKDHLRCICEDGVHATMEIPLVSRRGEILPVSSQSSPFEKTDRTTYALCVLTDLSRNRQIEDELLLTREDADAALRAKSTFLANMSHEIRTPMNGIIAMSELILSGELNREQRPHMEALHNSARTLLTLINDVLDISRIENGQITLQHKHFNLHNLLFDLRDMYQSLTAEKELWFELEIEETVPSIVRGDRERLQQILVNLLSNALKFTREGGLSLRARGSVAGETVRTVLFEVSDTGIGIPEENRRSIFESFTQADSAYNKSFQGPGLGLTIARQFARLMGGQLYAESSSASGSVFHVNIPLTCPSLQSSINQDTSSTEPPESNYRILVAESNPVDALLLVRILEKENMYVRSVSNGQELLDALSQRVFDLVVMGVTMPVMDGIEASRRIRKGECGGGSSSIPLLAVRSRATAEDYQICEGAGINSCISKPFSREALLARITGLLKERVDE